MYEVTYWVWNPFAFKSEVVAVSVYRWRWTARLACFFYNTPPPFMGFAVFARMRPRLRLVVAREASSANWR